VTADGGQLAVVDESTPLPAPFEAVLSYRRRGAPIDDVETNDADGCFYAHVLYQVEARVSLIGTGERLDCKLLLARSAFVLDTVR
jgi:hypothetical protein